MTTFNLTDILKPASSGYSGFSGLQGIAGTAVVLKGGVTNYASLPGGAVAGDLWITIDTGNGWVSNGSGSWSNVGHIDRKSVV